MIVFRIEDTYTQSSKCQGILAFDVCSTEAYKFNMIEFAKQDFLCQHFALLAAVFFLLQVTKNRFDGDLGVAPLTWDKESCTMSGHFNRPPPPSVAHNKTLTDSREKLPSTRVAPLTWDKESCTMSGHFNRPPPPSVAHNKTLTDSPGKLPSPHPRTVKELAFGTYRPQGSKLIGRAQNTPVKGTSSGSPLINQASTTSHGPSRRTV